MERPGPTRNDRLRSDGTCLRQSLHAAKPLFRVVACDAESGSAGITLQRNCSSTPDIFAAGNGDAPLVAGVTKLCQNAKDAIARADVSGASPS